jgi:hypothetical protein
MTLKRLFWLTQIGVFVIALSMGALAQNPVNFQGSIRDFTPASNVSGPWEITGEWFLHLNGNSGTADFSAALTMVRSDEGVLINGGGNLDDPKGRNAHTHHIILTGGTVTPITNGFEVTGAATITGNGNFPPPFGPNNTLTIDIVGGNTVAPSNIKLTLSGDAVKHFGAQVINGVVRE